MKLYFHTLVLFIKVRREHTNGQKGHYSFGTGKYFENYMLCEGGERGRTPLFAVDNDSSRTGSIRCGIEVKSPEVLRAMDRDSFYVVICIAQRTAIVSAISYVDRVVPVDFSNMYKIDVWHRYHYDCHFSGNDHGADWTYDLQQLREVRADMEFFEYTKATFFGNQRADMVRKKVQSL